MKTAKTRSLVLLGTSTVMRELAATLTRAGVDVRFVNTAQAAYEALQDGERRDLLAVEMTAVGLGDIGLADLAEAARRRERDSVRTRARVTHRAPIPLSGPKRSDA